MILIDLLRLIGATCRYAVCLVLGHSWSRRLFGPDGPYYAVDTCDRCGAKRLIR